MNRTGEGMPPADPGPAGSLRGPAAPALPLAAGSAAALAPALLGLLGSALVLVGTLPRRSPYVVKIPGAWFLGRLPPRPQPYPGPAVIGWTAFFGVVAVLGGVALLGIGFVWLVEVQARARALRAWQAGAVIAGWLVPMLLVAPLFSRDVYTYAAQGQMLALHIDPYRHGPAVLGVENPFTRLADPIWRRSVSPYGPLSLLFDEAIVVLAGHAVLASVEGLRLLSLAGVLLACAGAASIAKSIGRDPVLAALLVGANPLVLTSLVAGAHDDALMIGLCSAGLALALSRRRSAVMAGIVLVALAASAKAPAAVALPYIGWSRFAPAGASRRRRFVSAALTTAGGLVVVEAVTAGSGLGWGWIRGLSNAGLVRLWLSPTTGFGMVVADLARAAGVVHGRHAWLTVIDACRDVGLALAAAVLLWLLDRCRGDGFVRSTGLALLAAALLGTALWPWYLCWGIALLAPVVTPRGRALLVGGSVAASYLGVPAGSVLIALLEHAGWGALAMAAVLAAAAAALVATMSAVRRGGPSRGGPSRGGSGRSFPAVPGGTRAALRAKALR